jgi:hypothetical protein
MHIMSINISIMHHASSTLIDLRFESREKTLVVLGYNAASLLAERLDKS